MNILDYIAIKKDRIDWQETERKLAQYIQQSHPHARASEKAMMSANLSQDIRKLVRKHGARLVVKVVKEQQLEKSK